MSFWFSLVIIINVHGSVYFRCDNGQMGDHLKLCKLLQSIDLNTAYGINLDNYTNYCGLSFTKFDVKCDYANDSITGISLRSFDWETLDYQFNFTDNLGLPSLLEAIELNGLYLIGSFDFEYIYPLKQLKTILFTGSYNKRKLNGTIDWNRMLQMPNLQRLFLFARNFNGNLSDIKDIQSPLRYINVCYLYTLKYIMISDII